MSPEQIVRPREVDSCADVYSFGCVLYAMLAGSPPFGVDGETDFYIKDCHVRTPPPPILYRNPAISPAVEQVVRKCLEKNPVDRYQTCGAVMNALDTALAGRTNVVSALLTATRPVPPPPPQPVPAPTPAPAPQPAIVRTRTIALTPAPAAPPTPPWQPAPGLTLQPIQPHTPLPIAPSPPIVLPQKKRGKGLLIGGIAAVLVVAAAVYFLFFFPPETMLRLEGSTTVGDALAPAMLKAFLANEGAKDIEDVPASGDDKDHRDVRAKLPDHWRPVVFSVIANGSPNAFKALAAGRADIGMASRPIKDDEVRILSNLGDMRSPACEYIVALDGIAVIVNRNNPVPPLTRQQLNAIFRGTITDWAPPKTRETKVSQPVLVQRP